MTFFRNIRRTVHILWCVPFFAFLCSSCFTGVESTRKIGRSDVRHQKAAEQSAEQRYLSSILPERLGSWSPGKEFLVSDERIKVIFTPASNPLPLSVGDTLRFVKTEEVVSPVGKATDLYFSRSQDTSPYIYRINSSLDEILQRDQVEIPFTVEMSIPRGVDEKLRGKEFYVITPRWFDLNGNLSTRIKYIPVKIIDVLPGNHEFPVKIIFSPIFKGFNDNDRFAFYMSVGNTTTSSRNFETLFSLKNPRDKYPAITDEIWDYIIQNRVKEGMTRDEARLALGSPVDVDRGHDYSSVYERWTYDGGVYLIFRDGFLETFRR